MSRRSVEGYPGQRPWRFPSADLSDGLARSPVVVRCPHGGTQTLSERKAQSVGERHAAARSPCDGSLLGIVDRDGLELQVVAREQRPRQRPVAAMRPDLLSNLGPVRCAARTAVPESCLDGSGALFPLEERQQGGCVEDVHAASSASARWRLSASSSPTRSIPARSARTSDFSCSRLTSTPPPGESMSTTGVPSTSPALPRSSAGMTRRPRSPIVTRSEERRVGQEGRSRWSPPPYIPKI